MTQMVYQGIIRRITHDDSSCKIQLEDLTEKLAHKELPRLEYDDGRKGRLGGGKEISDRYKNQPIPICYGVVNKSPLVVSESFRRYQADSRQIENFISSPSDYTNANGDVIPLDTLQVNLDDTVYNVIEENQYDKGADSIYLKASVFSIPEDAEENDVYL